MDAWKRTFQDVLHETRVPPVQWIRKVHALKNLEAFKAASFIAPSIRKRMLETVDYEWSPKEHLHLFCVTPDSDAESVAFVCMLVTEFFRRVFHRNEPDVNIVLLDIPKLFPPALKNFADPEYVNSGVTFGSHTILIWRKEELTKVLIHELVHAYQMDRFIPDKELSALFHQLFTISGDSACVPREAVTELVTMVISAILVSPDNYRSVFAHQVSWGWHQSRLIVSKLPRDARGRMIQKTDVLSYYVLRTLLGHALVEVRPDLLLAVLFDQKSARCLVDEIRKKQFWDSNRSRGEWSNSTSLRMSPPDLFAGTPLSIE